MKKINKQKSHAFGKDIYLLGIDSDGKNMWLEAASWDCGRYWGFGYIETYTNNKNPHLAKDISSHTHWGSSIYGRREVYSHEKGCFVNGDFCHTFNDHKEFTATVLNDKENWTLSELMKTAYSLKESAELFGRGGSHITDNPCADTIKNAETTKHINEVLLPAVFNEIYKILTPMVEV